MAVKKKNISLVEDLPESPPQIEAQPEQPVKKVKNFLRQEWEEVVPVSPAEKQADKTTQDETVVLIDDRQDDFDDFNDEGGLRSALSELRSGAGKDKISVWELPNYRNDKIASLAHAENIFRGTVNVPSHISTSGELLSFIQDQFATSGKDFYDFKLAVRGRRLGAQDLPIVRVSASPRLKPEGSPQGGTNDAVQAAPVARDSFEELERQAKTIERLRRILSPPPAAPETSILPAGQPLTTEAAILKLISDDPEKVTAIANKFIGGSEKSDAMPAWLSALLPVVAPLLTSLAQRLMQPPLQEPPAIAPPPAVIAAPTPPHEPPFAAKYRYLIGRILYGIENDFAADYIGEEIAIECDKDAALDAAFSGLVGVPTMQLKAQLASLSPESAKVTARDNCDKFLSDLQIYLAGESESADEK